MQGISKNSHVSVETLLKQLTKLEEQNQKLLDKNINLEEKNQDLNIQVTQLQTDVKQLTKNRDKKPKTIAIDTLRKVFTPGQITMLMTPTKNRVNWSAEDIMSAISLRSLSPKAYRFLRDVKKFLYHVHQHCEIGFIDSMFCLEFYMMLSILCQT